MCELEALNAIFNTEPFLDIDVDGAAENNAGDWIANYNPGGGAITVTATTLQGQNVVWASDAPAGNGNGYIYTVPLNNPVNVQNVGNVITITATCGDLSETVSIKVVPLVTALDVAANHYTFEDDTGNYALCLNGVDGVTAADITSNLQVTTNPDTVNAKSHVIWTAINRTNGDNAYHLSNGAAGVKGIRLNQIARIETRVSIADSVQVYPNAVSVNVRAPATHAALANNLGVELHSFAYAGNGRFYVTCEDPNHFNGRYSKTWRHGGHATPQGYAAGSAIAFDNVTLRVTAAPSANLTVYVRCSVYYPTQNNGLTIARANGNVALQNGALAGSDHNLGAFNVIAGQVPNEVMHLNPLLTFWEVSTDNVNWSALQISANTVYITARAPAATTNPRLNRLNPITHIRDRVYTYDSLLAMSCEAAAGTVGGNVTVAAVRAQIFDIFNVQLNSQNDRVQRLNRNTGGAPTRLIYWRANHPPAQGLNYALGTTGTVFSNPWGSVACGAWAEMLQAMWALHGIADGHKVAVNTNVGLEQDAQCFLVKNWDYDVPPAMNVNALTHDYPADVRRGVRVHAQNNAASPRWFGNHFIIYDATNQHYYDPSYGADAANPANWVLGACDGLLGNEVTVRYCFFRHTQTKAGYATINMGNITPNTHAVTMTDLTNGALLW